MNLEQTFEQNQFGTLVHWTGLAVLTSAGKASRKSRSL